MVTIINYKECKNALDETFYALTLQGDIELVRSTITGKLYATARTISITSTFNETACKALIGKQLPGYIRKVTCDGYDYTIPGTTETIKLTYCFEYCNDPVSTEEA